MRWMLNNNCVYENYTNIIIRMISDIEPCCNSIVVISHSFLSRTLVDRVVIIVFVTYVVKHLSLIIVDGVAISLSCNSHRCIVIIVIHIGW